jgi:hypothetical protein
MIVAGNFRLEDTAHGPRATCDIRAEGFGPHLSFDVHPDNRDAIDVDEPNWAAVALIYPAMLMGRDLVIEADLSPLLLENLRNDFMALVRNFEPLARPIRIEAGATVSPAYRDGTKDVVTGMSFGVDSLSTYLRYTRPEAPKGARLTGVAVYQVGAFGATADPSIRVDRARQRCEDVLSGAGMTSYSLSANMDEVFEPASAFGPADFLKTVGFRNAAAGLVLQKRLGTYLASSNVEYARATFGPWFTTESLDPAFQPLLSTEGLCFQSGLAGIERFDKIATLADHPMAHAHLDVCVGKPGTRFVDGADRNCSQCWKCTQTMIALDSLGKLDAFEAVFDLDLYRRDWNRIVRIGINNAAAKGPLSSSQSVIERARSQGLDLPAPDSAFRIAARQVRRRLGRVRRSLNGMGP